MIKSFGEEIESDRNISHIHCLPRNVCYILQNIMKLISSKGPVTLGSDYRTILKSDPILLVLKSELDVPILKIDKFAVTLLRFIAADFFIARKMRQ